MRTRATQGEKSEKRQEEEERTAVRDEGCGK